MIPLSKPLLGTEEKKEVEKVMDLGFIAQGEQVHQFEEKFAKYVGVDHAVSCANGTAALTLALSSMRASGEVLVPSFTFFGSVSSIVAAGLKPVFVDIDPSTYCLNVRDAKKKVTSKTCAVMPVHLYGLACNMDEVQTLGLPIIEDACQAHGAEWDGKKVGSFGQAGCFSFYATKNMTCGEGGMVTTNDKKLATVARSLRDHGQSKRYVHEEFGANLRLTDIQAAIGLVQLNKLDKFNEARRKNAEYYSQNLEYTFPFTYGRKSHVYHLYTISLSNRDKLQEVLGKARIGCGVYYPVPCHRQPAVNSMDRLAFTEEACKRVLSIPVHPGLSKRDLEYVVEVLNDFKHFARA